MVEGERVGEEERGLPVGGAGEGLLAGERQVPDRLGGDAASGPVVGKQGVEPGQLGLMLLLVPLGDGAVQGPALGSQHQVIGHVPGDDVLEHPGQLRLGRLEQDQVAALEAVQLIGQGRAVSRDGVDVGQQPVGEAAPDDAGHLQRQLLGAARRSMRVRTTPCTVSGSDSTRRSAPGATWQIPSVMVMAPVSRSA